MSYKIFEVQYGSIYKKDSGCIIESMAVILDKNASVLKYGSADNGLYDYYTEMVAKYRKIGLEDMANDLIYIEFDKYNDILTKEEICTFVNYMVLCSCNGQKIYQMLQMSPSQLKEEIKKLAGFGY